MLVQKYDDTKHGSCRPTRELIKRLDPTDLERVRSVMACEPEGIVCANDWTAAV